MKPRGRTFDAQSALRDGMTWDQIGQFLQKNPDIQLQGAQQAAQTQPQQEGGNFLSNALQFGLPIAGATLGALIPGLGETGISEAAGGAGGQALADLLTGKQPGADVATTGALSAGGPILGKILGGVGGKIGAAADQLLGKPGADVFNSVVSKDPWMTQNVGKLQQAASDFGYMDKPMVSSLNQMPQDFKNIDTQIQSAIKNNDTSIPLVSANEGQLSLLDNFNNQMEGSSYGQGDPGYFQATQGIANRIANLSSNDVTDAASIYNEKKAMSNLLSNTFDKQARGGTLSAKEEANLAYFNALKDTLDQYGSEGVRALNTRQNQLYDIAKAFGNQVAKSPRGAAFSFKDILPIGEMGIGAHFLGLSPFLGMGVAAGGEALGRNPGALSAISGILGRASGALSSPVAAGVGASLAPTLNTALGLSSPSVIQNPTTSVNNQQSTNNNTQNTQVNSSPFNSNISQNQQVVKSYDGQQSFPTQLTPPSQLANTIPGQTYTLAQYNADISKADQIIQNNPQNPVAYELASQLRANAEAHKSANDQVVQTYLSQNQLSPDQQDFMRTAQPDWNQMVQLHELLQTNGGKNVFQAFINEDPTVQRLQAARDPRAAVMYQLLNQAKLSQLRAAQGGAVRSYDLALSQLGPGQTSAANSAIIEQAMRQFLSQYQELAPLYGLSQQQVPNTVSGQQAIQNLGPLYQTLFQSAGE